MARFRALAVLGAVAVVLASASVTTARSVPRQPTGPDDWARFTPAERKAAIDYQWELFQAQLEAGTAVIQSTESADGLALIAAATATYDCPIQWTDRVQGSWTRGGGWTQATASMYTIYAGHNTQGQPGQYLGKFRRDGVLLNYWQNYTHNTDRAEAWSPWNWKWWFEHPLYSNGGYHGAQQYEGGTWQLGPNRFCSKSRQS